MKRRLALLLGVLATAVATQAKAQIPINYSTFAGWDGAVPTHTAVHNVGGITLTFNGLTGQSATALPAPGSHISFGTIDLSVPFGTPLTALGTHTFTLLLDQIIPPAGSGNFIGTLTGSVSSTASTAEITFTTPTFTIGGVTYNIQNPTLVVAPSTNGGTTTLQGEALAPVPEPATLALMGTGLALLGVTVRRRRRA